MLTAIVRGSLHFRVLVLILAGLMLAIGLYSVRAAKYDVFPEFIPPMVVVQTEAPGFGPEEVEALVTRPIEYSLNGTVGLKTLRSNSIQGLSVATAIFRDDMNVLTARQLVGEKLAQLAGRLPQGVRPPVMAPLTSSSGIVLRIGMTSRTTTPMELRTVADWTVRPRLLGVPGVANVTIFGGEVRQYQVLVHPEKLLAYDIALDQVLDAARQSNALVGAGFIEDTNQRVTVIPQASLSSIDQLTDVAVKLYEGLPIRLSQVADVTIGPEPKFGDASVAARQRDGTIAVEPAVTMAVYKQLGANTLEVSEAVEAMLDSIRDALPEGVELHPRLFRQATFIERSLGNMNIALLEGGVLVVIVLFLFLANVRTALISMTAIPLSLLTAVAVLKAFGQTINTLTLGGLAIAIGEVVDDAIIDVENIYRRLRETVRDAGSGTRDQDAGVAAQPTSSPNSQSLIPNPLQIVLEASVEVRSAVVFATFIVAVVFIPIFFMSGIQGKLFAPLGYAYVLSIMASLAVALTVTPAMSAVLLLGRPLPPEETRLLRWLKQQYGSLLSPTLNHPGKVGLAALALFAAAIATVPFMGAEFIPELNEGSYSIHMAGLPGTSLGESLRVGSNVLKDLAALPVVDQVTQQVGRAELSEDIWGSNYSELMVTMKPLEGEAAEEARDQLRAVLVKYPGFYFSIKPFLTERIEEVISGTTADVAIRIYGPDLVELDRLAEQVAAVLRKIRGASDVAIEQQTGVPELRLVADLDACNRYGLRSVQLQEVLRTAFQGTTVNQVYEGTRVIDLVVRLAPEVRQSLQTIRSMLIDTPGAGRVPLENLVSVVPTSGRSLIAHEGTSRRALVQCNVRGRDVDSFLREVQHEITGQVPRSMNYLFEFGGEAQAARAARNEILALSAAVLAGITILLYAVFNSWRLLALVLTNLPFALVGGVAAVFLSGAWVSIGALVGFVTLFGISTRNSIMLLSHYQHLVEVEGQPWNRATLVRGAMERLSPILMTALVTALGLLPIAIGGSTAGREVEQPMAMVILGGLVTSTALNLLVLPTLVGRFAHLVSTADAHNS